MPSLPTALSSLSPPRGGVSIAEEEGAELQHRRNQKSTSSRFSSSFLHVANARTNPLPPPPPYITQTPTLFNGSLKANLDPFDDFSERELWAALETVQMSDQIKSVGGLEYSVADGGNNFSVGQKQLLCLARAVLLKCNILLLDEPSANVDTLTDQHLQLAIGVAFKGSTIISIAHRLDSIIEYDKVLVVGDGKTVEFGPPAALLDGSEGSGLFERMVKETGSQTESMLREKASRAAREREKNVAEKSGGE